MKKKRSKKSEDSEKEAFLKKLGKKYSKELIDKATSWEIKFRKILDSSNIEYIFQYPVICEKKHLYIIDFYLPKYKLAFELDGAHHYEKENIRKDNFRTKKLKALGIEVKRIMNRNVDLINSKMLIDFIKNFPPKLTESGTSNKKR